MGEPFYKFGPRTFTETFESWHAGDVGEGADDWRRYVKGRVWRAVRPCNEEDFGWRKCCRSWATEPVDHLLARFQHMDEVGNAILDVNYEPTNPILETHQRFHLMVGLPVAEGPLRSIFYHWERDASTLDDLTTESRRIAVSMDSQVSDAHQ